MKETKVIEVNIDDLGVDSSNIRGGEWNYDEELVNSIKDNGVLEPLIVRRFARGNKRTHERTGKTF